MREPIFVINRPASHRTDITDAFAERAVAAQKPVGGGLGIAAIDIH
jgi:hypothetical protein